MSWRLALVGVAAGLLSGLLGIGGGIVIVPGLIWAAGLTRHTASGTSLLAILPNAVVSAITYAVAPGGAFEPEASAIFIGGSLAGAILGAKTNARVRSGAGAAYAQPADTVVGDLRCDVAGGGPSVSHVEQNAALPHVGDRVVVDVQCARHIGLIVDKDENCVEWTKTVDCTTGTGGGSATDAVDVVAGKTQAQLVSGQETIIVDIDQGFTS